MNLNELINDGKIRKTAPDRQQAVECIAAAERDLRLAKKIISEDLDWAFSIAYNSVLQSARALMFAEGFEATGENHHKTTMEYIEVKIGAKVKEEVEYMNRMRKKRHDAVYFSVGAVSESEAKHAIEFATKFLALIKEKLKMVE